MSQSITRILPVPFEWIAIPGGTVKLETGETHTVADFTIAKYPITNAQYQIFVDDPDGYCNVQWWNYLKQALDWRYENAQPQDPEFEGNTHPRTRVCWYEAVAFCQWLSAKTGQTITLPTESQWQRAAQGDDERVYPWGNDWDGDKCHNSVAPVTSKRTTPVAQYEGEGDSPFGVVGMAGNVWEWCLTDYETGHNDIADYSEGRVRRGGSWLNNGEGDFRCDFRNDGAAEDGYYNEGFRIVRW